ncbi:nuclear transport factor 2 family protein [Nocardia sp. NPDC127526]|uniref:nuclear transport factor 2 family protein n=1 Tax=Nocardia sp. NPDC127526 TaxID=3345393 RepID=UPI003631408B
MTHFDDKARDLMAALESGATGDQLRPFFHPDAVQVEHPSRVVPAGRTRALNAMLEASIAGARLFASQRYDIQNTIAVENRVAVQLRWSGVLAQQLQDHKPGDVLEADVAMFLTYDDAGRILRQESYDCYP